MARKINPNFKALHSACLNQAYDKDDNLIAGKRGQILEGSSRSGKTISSIDFIILLCVRHETNCVINIVKETYNEFKTTLYNDFHNRLLAFGLHSPFEDAKEVASFKIFGNKINFLGADKPSKFHGAQCKYLWLNEPIPIAKAIFDQAEMRCTKFWWMDLNPSVTEHWIFDQAERSDVGFLRTTYLDNPFLSIPEKNKILGYEPYETGSYEIVEDQMLYNGELISKTNQPPPNVKNIEERTADEFNWKVYGLGLRGSMKGVIFSQVEYIDKFPDVGYSYGMDFGFTVDPCTLIKCAEDEFNIWLELLHYSPLETAEDVNDMLIANEVEKNIPITADSSDRYVSENNGVVLMVEDLYDMGWRIDKVSKTKSIMYWILSMKKKKIHIVRNKFLLEAKKEQENYIMKEINGIPINQPVDKHNHFWDGSRYRHMAYNEEEINHVIW